MGVIGKIRSYSGLLIAIIGVGLVAFVLGDLFQYGPARGTRPDMEVARVGSESISFPEFDERYNQHLENWKHQTGETSPNQLQMHNIRRQAWEQMVNEVVLEKELEKLGIGVSSDELLEMVTGADPHPSIVQSFTSPETGEFQPEQVRNFIQNIDRMEPQMRNQWMMLEQNIKKDRKQQKYQNLIRKSFYVPETLAEINHYNNNSVLEISFLAKNYDSISDDELEISEADIKKAYEENKHNYKQDPSRDIEYVVLPVFPTDEDRKNEKEEVLALMEELKTVEDVELFINSVSDQPFDPQYHSKDGLSSEIDSVMFNSTEGTVYGPYERGDAFVVTMLNDVQLRPDSMSATHILISHQRANTGQQQQVLRNYYEAEEKSDSLLNVVQSNPEKMPELAMQLSDDPSARMNQGDLGWFNDGDMVTEFNEAVVNGSIGDVVSVETDFGFHIIHITGHSPKSKKVQVAKIIRSINPGSSTYRELFREMSEFATVVREEENFEAAAQEKGYSIREATNVGKMDNTLPGVRNAREIIRWVYDENTKIGSISRIFDLDDKFVLAKLVNINKEGVAPLEDVRNEIEEIVINDKKFDIIADEMAKAINKHGSLVKAAEDLQIEVNYAKEYKWSNTNLPGYSREPKVIGKAFALNEGEISNPIQGNNAVFVLEVTSKTKAIIPDDLTTVRKDLENNMGRKINQLKDALKENTEIEDKRHKFF